MFGARVIWAPGEWWIHSLTWCQLEDVVPSSIFHLPTFMLEGLMDCYILLPRYIDSVLFRWGRSFESVFIPWPYPHFAEFSGAHASLITNAHALSCWIVTSNMMLLWNSWYSLLDIIIWMQLARGVRCTECSQAKGCLLSVFEPFDFDKDVRCNLVFGWLVVVLARGHKESLTFSLSFLFWSFFVHNDITAGWLQKSMCQAYSFSLKCRVYFVLEDHHSSPFWALGIGNVGPLGRYHVVEWKVGLYLCCSWDCFLTRSHVMAAF